MIRRLKTIISEAQRRIATDESGLSTTRYLDRCVKEGKITEKESDEIFHAADYDVWIAPWDKQMKHPHKREKPKRRKVAGNMENWAK